ncbi:ankyrin repeat domain-containing protein SOWAHA-like [Aulostomus maculatus]
MAFECSQCAVLDFLTENGVRVRNCESIDHFTAVSPEELKRKEALQEAFKRYVNNIAFVKTENGVKNICQKKKFRGSARDPDHSSEAHPEAQGSSRFFAGPGRTGSSQVCAAPQKKPAFSDKPHTPGSGYGNDSRLTVPHDSLATILTDGKNNDSACHRYMCVAEDVDSSADKMGNTESFLWEKRKSERVQDGGANIPVIAVIEASPLPTEGTVFTLPGPRQEDPCGPSSTKHSAEPECLCLEPQEESEQIYVITSQQKSRSSEHQIPCRQLESNEREDKVQLDSCSLCGSDGNTTPNNSRKHFIEVMMNSSPQVRRSMVFHNSISLPSKSDIDSASLVSCSLEEDRASITLDPLEHEWMMCTSDGEWSCLHSLLITEPGLILRKDFITGFTCLHWAAKHGKPDLLVLMINFAKQHNIPISVDVQTNSGYTPLHIAAMHSHMEVIKLLVGAYDADVEVRDYSGKKASQYLPGNVSIDIRDIIGESSDPESCDSRDGGRWRFSGVLKSNLKLLNPSEWDSVDRDDHPREKLVRRNSSLSRMKPKLHKLRRRVSQIVHSTTFHDPDELEGSQKGLFKSRPKTHFLG